MKRAVDLCGRDDGRARSFAGEAFVLLEGLWLSKRSPVLLEGAAMLNGSDSESDAMLFDAAIDRCATERAHSVGVQRRAAGRSWAIEDRSSRDWGVGGNPAVAARPVATSAAARSAICRAASYIAAAPAWVCAT
jgi:hypothetical protein